MSKILAFLRHSNVPLIVENRNSEGEFQFHSNSSSLSGCSSLVRGLNKSKGGLAEAVGYKTEVKSGSSFLLVGKAAPNLLAGSRLGVM
jgi:hypothetical protein